MLGTPLGSPDVSTCDCSFGQSWSSERNPGRGKARKGPDEEHGNGASESGGTHVSYFDRSKQHTHIRVITRV